MSPPPAPPLFINFLASWDLIPGACRFEQGRPPQSGRTTIRWQDGELVFTIGFVDADDDHHLETLRGSPDGVPRPHEGALLDALVIDAPTPRALTITGTIDGKPRLIAEYQLDEHARAMRVLQQVVFEDGKRATNVSLYERVDAVTVH